jgi:hypothetical protein
VYFSELALLLRFQIASSLLLRFQIHHSGNSKFVIYYSHDLVLSWGIIDSISIVVPFANKMCCYE